jgi:hypothetical protein
MDALNLENYKKTEIKKLIVIFNQSVANLNNQFIITANSINKLRINIRVKQLYITNLRNKFNVIINNLNSKLNEDTKKINNLIKIRQPDKYALLIGINYNNTENQLNGCINDTNNIKTLLTGTYGFKNINLLTDDTAIIPTKDNIMKELISLLSNSISGDILFILYSGHGTQTTDISGDEIDGLDECIVPINAVNLNTCITDDELNNVFKTYLKPNVKVFCLFDSCFSGTILDLKYNYTTNNELIISKDVDFDKQLIVISGCSDTQTSSDAFINDTYTGAMTYSFLNSISPNIMLSDLIIKMREVLITNNFTQIPQLSVGFNSNITTLNLTHFINDV